MSKLGVKYFPEKTQIIFFDLEFYVPSEDREGRIGLKANPYKENHFLIGGTFTKFFPLLKNQKSNKTMEFWIWDYKSEKDMLSAILDFLEESWSLILKKDNQAELFFSGIGISRVDIQYLFARASKYKLRTEAKLFEIFYKSRFLDFETIVIPYFKCKDNMMKTKTTKDILGKFKIERERGPSVSIWEQYDAKEYEKIRERNVNEVSDLPVMYQSIINRIHSDSIIKRYSLPGYTKRKENLTPDEIAFLESCYEKDNEGWFVLKPILSEDNKEKLYQLQLK